MTTHAIPAPSAKRRYVSVGVSVLLHVLFILLPFIIGLFQSVMPYLVPHGKGDPDAGGGAQAATEKKNEEKKKRTEKVEKTHVAVSHRKDLKGLIFDPNSARDGSLRQNKVVDDLLKLTERTHEAGVVMGGKGKGTGGGVGKGKKGGKLGKGGVGPGGWPDGMQNGVVRFVRLEYAGEGWDDGMDPIENADVNFLNEIHEITGFKVAQKGESHSIRNLKLYPKGKAPPFVYFTGENNINIPAPDQKILRDYLMGGGLLFADCGTAQWNANFRRFIQQLLPNNPMVEIPDDDIIFQQPNEFPNGAPPLWHHGGRRMLGCKQDGRWIVLYCPGDVNDAWKTGNSGAKADVVEKAVDLGVNIVYYAFTQYLEKTARDR